MQRRIRMASIMRRRDANASRSDSRNADTHTNPNEDFDRGRRLLFQAGDFAFLVCVGIASTIVAHMVHDIGWPFVPTCLLAMVAAMAVQTLLAIMAAPILGSIESMAPSMIVAMASPMVVCAVHLAGREPTRFIAIVIGALVAVSMFVFVHFYGRSCISALRKESVDVPN